MTRLLPALRIPVFQARHLRTPFRGAMVLIPAGNFTMGAGPAAR